MNKDWREINKYNVWTFRWHAFATCQITFPHNDKNHNHWAKHIGCCLLVIYVTEILAGRVGFRHGHKESGFKQRKLFGSFHYYKSTWVQVAQPMCIWYVFFMIINLNVVFTEALIYDSVPQGQRRICKPSNLHNECIIGGLCGAPIYGDDFIHKVKI